MQDEELKHSLREPMLGGKHVVVGVGEDSRLEDYGEVCGSLTRAAGSVRCDRMRG